MVLCYHFHWNCLKEFAMDMSWFCYPVGGPEYLYLPVPGTQNWSLVPWCAIKFVVLIFGMSVSPVQSRAWSWAVGVCRDPTRCVTQQWVSVPGHRLALVCWDSFVWSGFLACWPLRQLFWNARQWWNQWGHFKSVASPECFLEPALTRGLCLLVSCSPLVVTT